MAYRKVVIMKVKLDKAKVEDAEVLKAMSVLSFTSDYEQYGSYPPDIESLDWHKSAIAKGHYYKISYDDKIAGGICVIPSVNDLIKIKYFFISDIYQNKGIGSTAMELIEKKYSNAKTWALVTPYKAYRNHHFYEKLGYLKVGEVQPDPHNEFKIFKYKKEILS
ncbi:MAG: GNAT superfamily N-acetyltransferase [Desulforhopalus sp.]|jgi:GNAT superfamily N-acetyltransferase